MTLTPEQRYTCYCIMLYYAERYEEYKQYYFGGGFDMNDDCCAGFCWMILRNFDIESDEQELALPELFEHAPIKRYGFWFATNKSGWLKRRRILEQITREMEQQLYV